MKMLSMFQPLWSRQKRRLLRLLPSLNRLFQCGPVVQQHMGLLLLGLSRERVQSIDGLLPAFQCEHHSGLSCSLYLLDQLCQLLLQLCFVSTLLRRYSLRCRRGFCREQL